MSILETLNIHNGLSEKFLSEWHPTKNHGINPDELTNGVFLPIPPKRVNKKNHCEKTLCISVFCYS